MSFSLLEAQPVSPYDYQSALPLLSKTDRETAHVLPEHFLSRHPQASYLTAALQNQKLVKMDDPVVPCPQIKDTNAVIHVLAHALPSRAYKVSTESADLTSFSLHLGVFFLQRTHHHGLCLLFCSSFLKTKTQRVLSWHL